MMTEDRYRELEADMTLKLTREELDEGWHFCYEWDQMLICKDWPEAECCLCYD